MNKYFDTVKEIIENYSDGKIKPLNACKETIIQYFKETDAQNPYRQLAKKWRMYQDTWNMRNATFNDCNACCCCEDKLFYFPICQKYC